MKINSLCRAITNLGKKGRSVEDDLGRIAEDLMKSEGKTRITMSGNDIPPVLQEMVKDIKNPIVTLGFNSHKNQVVGGLSIKSGRKTIGNVAVGIDKTKGDSPILQIKYKISDNGQKVSSLDYFINPNVNVTSSSDVVQNYAKKQQNINLHSEIDNAQFLDIYINEKPNDTVKQHGLPSFSEQDLKEIFKSLQKKSYIKQLKQTGKEITEFFTPAKSTVTKTRQKNTSDTVRPKHTVQSIAKTNAKLKSEYIDFNDIAEHIADFEGKPNIEFSEKTKNIILKKMGYEPEIIKVEKYTSDTAMGGFDCINGKLYVDIDSFDNFNDLTCTIIHETDHIDIFVKLAKKLGIDNFEKLMQKAYKEPDMKINREFYTKAVKYADVDNFNAKPFIKDILNQSKRDLLEKNSYYTDILNSFLYASNGIEKHARKAEKQLIKSLKNIGIQEKNDDKLFDLFTDTSKDSFENSFRQIETVLKKYGKEKPKIFNEEFDKALQNLNPEFHVLYKKFFNPNESLSEEELIKINEFYNSNINLLLKNVLNSLISKM